MQNQTTEKNKPKLLITDFRSTLVDAEVYDTSQYVAFVDYGIDYLVSQGKSEKEAQKEIYINKVLHAINPRNPSYLALRNEVVEYAALQGKYAPRIEDNIIASLKKTRDSGLEIVLFTSVSSSKFMAMFKNIKTENCETLGQYISLFFDPSDIGAKDSEESYRRICRLFNMKPSDAIVIGAQENSLQSALKAEIGRVYKVQPWKVGILDEIEKHQKDYFVVNCFSDAVNHALQ